MLYAAPPARAQGPEEPPPPGEVCVECHGKAEITPWIATTWKKSRHAAEGITCDNCHGNHDAGFDSEDFIPRPGAEQCGRCHPIRVREAASGKHAGTVKCTSCHPRHTFSLNVARNPMICTTCHAESQHVQGYKTSKMGVIYQTEGAGSAATCQGCHMPDGTHNVSLTIAKREQMLRVCNRCHSASFAGEVLSHDGLRTHW